MDNSSSLKFSWQVARWQTFETFMHHNCIIIDHKSLSLSRLFLLVFWPWGRLILLAEILAYNKSALCRSASPAFSFDFFVMSNKNEWNSSFPRPSVDRTADKCIQRERERGSAIESRGGGGSWLRISSDGDDRRIFGGLKFFIPGIFFLLGGLGGGGGVGKVAKFFWWLDISLIFLDVQNNPLRIRGTSRVSRPRSPSNKVQPNLLMLGNSAWDILGLRFGPARNVLGFVGSPRGFLCFFI